MIWSFRVQIRAILLCFSSLGLASVIVDLVFLLLWIDDRYACRCIR